MTKRLTILPALLLWTAAASAAGYEVRINGAPQQVEPFKHYHYVSCTPEGAAEFTVTVPAAVSSAEVSPLSRGVEPSIEGSTVRFRLPEAGQYLVRLNDTAKLFIFAEKPALKVEGTSIMEYKGIDNTGTTNVTAAVQRAIDACAKKGRTLIFPAGEYLCGQLRLPSHAHLHLERGAVIRADASSAAAFESNDDVKTRRFIYVKDAKDIRITGLGAIDGSGRALREKFGDKARIRLLLAVNSSDLHFEGVMFRDPGSWNTQILLCRDVVLRNIKLMNDTELSNTDGFDPDASRNLLIENCFGYCSDDNVAVKTTGYSGYLGDAENITVRGCVFLTKKSSLKVGTETRGTRMSGITFEDNDVLESDRGMALYVSDGTALSDVRYLNNRFERNHPDSKRMMFQFSVNARRKDSPIGSIRGVEIRNCSFRAPFPKAPEIKCPARGDIEGIVFENLTVGGKKILAPEQIALKCVNAEATFK